MSRPEDGLLSLATAIADGTPAEWNAVEPDGEEERRLIEALRLVARLRELHTAPAADDAPERWGPLEVLECIGAGGFGRVYRARDTVLDREVALKLTPVDAGRRDAALREARLLARVHHPNVVTVHGADHRDGRVGIWMERVNGRTLLEIVRSGGPLDAGEATRIGVDLCRALGAVHAAGLVHRDVKAGNVMRDETGRVLLMDFGAGRELGGGGRAAAGTPLYMAPELLRGEPPTRGSDLYALGVLLYYLVTAGHPVEGETVEGLRDAHRRARRARLSDRRPDLPAGFVHVVDRALDPSPSGRYRSAEEMAAGLAGSLRPRSRRRLLAAAVAGLAALGVLWIARPVGNGLSTIGREAQIREALGAYDEARPLYERLLELQERRYGPGHVEVAHVLVRLAHVRDALGDPAEARALYRRALLIYETQLGASHPSVAATQREVAAPAADRADRGDPFVRPLTLERRLDAAEPASPAESPLYTVEAAIEDAGGRPLLRLKASEPLFVYVLGEGSPGKLSLLFPLPGAQPVNPVPPAAVHHLPAAPGPLVVVASPVRLAEFEDELRRLRVPGAGETLTRVPLSEPTLRALRSAFGDPSALDRARTITGHAEIVRGLWIRRAGVR
jgi:tetratricopeptide (TPR) repeat protein